MKNPSTKKGALHRIDYRWTLIIILLIASIVNYMDRATLSVANVAISHQFGFSTIEMGLLLSAFMWPYALANLPAGWLIDKFGINKIFLFGIILWSISSVMGGLVVGFASMYMARVLLGIAEAPFFIIAGKVTQHYFKKEERGVAASVVNLGPRIANGIAPPILVVLMIFMGWRLMFISLGILGIFITIIWIKFYKKDDALETGQTKKIVEKSEVQKKVSIWKLFRHPTMICLIIGNIGSSYVFWLYITWLPDYLMESRHLSLAKTGLMAAIPFISAIFAVMIGGYISDYFIKKGMKATTARLIPIVGGCLLSGAAVFPINYITSTPLTITLISVSLFCVELRTGVLWAMVGDLSPKESVGMFGGIQNFANFIGGTLAPIGTGFILYYAGGNFNWVFITSGIFCIVGAISYSCIRRPVKIEEIIKT